MSRLNRGHLHLYTNGNESYILVPADEGSRSLSISRTTGEVKLNLVNAGLPPSARPFGKEVYGIFGLIALTLSEYLIVITGRIQIGWFAEHAIYRATDFDILPLHPDVSAQHPSHPVEANLLALVRSHLLAGMFLFSYTYDITRRLQSQLELQQEYASRAMWEMADDRFFWNKFVQTKFIDLAAANTPRELTPFVLPVLYGTFDIRRATVSAKDLQICLISRRSRFRAGTRYFRRGIDQEGHVANFNETEQLVFIDAPPPDGLSSFADYTHKFSFVQIRGSVPLFWTEINTLRYKPDLQIMELQETVDTMRAHLLEQVSMYGDQTLVNLVNQKGHEQPVKEAYERYVSQVNLPRVKYQYFDFHNECKHMRWERISTLIDMIQDELDRSGWLHMQGGKPGPERVQQGIVRTNCMDNLDRTNVVQAALAKRALNLQLQSINLIPVNGSIDDYDILSRDFREMWADHADLISRAYAGSGALKTDFTRTGKRSREGALQDGYKSVLRYIKNNYFDGGRQDAFDLMTGNWVPRPNPQLSAFLVNDPRPLFVRATPYVTFFSVFMICAGLTLPRTSDYSLTYYFAFWFFFLAISLGFIFIHGIDYVNWPRLVPLDDAIHYTGPGFRSGHKGKGFGVKGKDVGVKIGASVGSAAKLLSSASGRKRSGSYGTEIELGTKKRVD